MDDDHSLLVDLQALCTKHGIPAALLVIPQTAAQFVLIANQISSEELRCLGHMLVKNIPDERHVH